MPRGELDDAITGAAEFLSERRSRDGLWRDFHTRAGASADWVTAFTCYAARGCDELASDVDTAVTALAERQRPNGGWAYNHAVPTDCDSTSWALLALSIRGAPDAEAVERGRGYVLAHQSAEAGGFATYSETDGIDAFVGAPDADATADWLAPHACVTSVAVQALLAHGEPADATPVTSARDYLLRAREENGGWMSYWWPGQAYNTYFALRALLAVGAIESSTAGQLVEDRVKAARHRQPFGTALRLLTMLLAPGDAARRASEPAVDWLLRSQQPDGGWSSHPILRIPPPIQRDPQAHVGWSTDGRRGSGVIVADPRRVFTSAAVLWALTGYRMARS
jgi:squalene-hopene/tetraprenyl-beta-curcumene cyclase